MNKAITLVVIGDQQLVCEGCEQRVERALKGQPGVQKVRANARNQCIDVLSDTATLNADTIAERVRELGYQTRVVDPTSAKS